MPYKPTGNPPGRPRKTEPIAPPPDDNFGTAPVISSGELAAVQQANEQKRVELSRAREGFRRGAFDPSTALHRPPRFGQKRREVGKRPILHPNVIKG
jgi:hypothetical protein